MPPLITVAFFYASKQKEIILSDDAAGFSSRKLRYSVPAILLLRSKRSVSRQTPFIFPIFSLYPTCRNPAFL